MATKERKEKVRLITPVFRASYPHLFKAVAMQDSPGATPKFSVCALWTPKKFSDAEKDRWKKILAKMQSECRTLFKCDYGLPTKMTDTDNYGHVLAKKKPSARRGLRNGLEREGVEGYGEGVLFANLNSVQKPGVINRDGDDIGPEFDNADEIYPGCYCEATVSVFAYNKGGGTGIAIGLNNVRKVKDGPRLDNRVAAKDDFDEDVESQWLDEDGDGDGDGDDFGDGDDSDFN